MQSHSRGIASLFRIGENAMVIIPRPSLLLITNSHRPCLCSQSDQPLSSSSYLQQCDAVTNCSSGVDLDTFGDGGHLRNKTACPRAGLQSQCWSGGEKSAGSTCRRQHTLWAHQEQGMPPATHRPAAELGHTVTQRLALAVRRGQRQPASVDSTSSPTLPHFSPSNY